MQSAYFTFKAKVWLYPGKAAWHFVTLPKKLSQELSHEFHGIKAGFGSLPVAVTIGKTQWETSIFPDSKEGAYLLPLKSAVRKSESFKSGDIITVRFAVRV